MNVDKAAQFISEICLYAGNSIIMPGFHSDSTSISYKSRTDLVTNIDTEAEEYLINRIHDTFPGCDIIAEESGIHESGSDYVWIVDPLDGTNNFAHGIPHFSVTVGLFSREKNDVVAGAVYHPVLDELFTAVRGKGAYLNRNRIQVSKTAELGISVVATGFAYDKENDEINNLSQFNGVLPCLQGVRRFGSAALDLANTACGRLDGYWEAMINAWDISAGVLIVKEAGGRVSDYSGKNIDIFKHEIIATNGFIHAELQGLVEKNTKCFPSSL